MTSSTEPTKEPFPTPEVTVPRYEVWRWVVDQWGQGSWSLENTRGRYDDKIFALQSMNITYLPAMFPSVLYDRQVGKVTDTNEEVLRHEQAKADTRL